MGEDANLKRWRETTKSLLDAVDNLYCQPYSICMVPEELRKQNAGAYEPKVVSMGPRFKGKRNLQQMEEIKWRCMLCLLSRTKEDGTKILETCMREMLELDSTVRACYGEEIVLDRYDLATVMVYDGCFLLELAISREKDWSAMLPQNSLSASDLGTKVGEMEAVLSDLTILENQVPFFILDKLFQLLFPGSNLSNSIETMVMLLWQQQLPKRIYPAHLVELVHSTFLWMQNIPIQDSPSFLIVDIDDSNSNTVTKQVHLNRCAARLIAAGVTIRIHPGSDVPVFRIHDLSVQFSYSNGLLLIPHVRITHTTESKWRSFIAWEHHRNKSKNEEFENNNTTEQNYGIEYANVFTFLALLFKDLICCASDVQILKNKGIIKDEMGLSNHEVLDFFGSIANGIDRGRVDSSYSNVVEALNGYSGTNFVTRFPILACHDLSRITEWFYGLNRFLRRGYNSAAALITLLTVVQTCYSVLSYHYADDNNDDWKRLLANVTLNTR